MGAKLARAVVCVQRPNRLFAMLQRRFTIAVEPRSACAAAWPERAVQFFQAARIEIAVGRAAEVAARADERHRILIAAR